jgi:hypothetical protein
MDKHDEKETAYELDNPLGEERARIPLADNTWRDWGFPRNTTPRRGCKSKAIWRGGRKCIYTVSLLRNEFARNRIREGLLTARRFYKKERQVCDL